jgi:hypothetical protein
VTVSGYTLTEAGCTGIYLPVDASIRWYYVCPAGTVLPATLSDGTVITTCPYEVKFEEQRFTDSWTGTQPPLANCMSTFIWVLNEHVGDYCGL